MKRALVVMVVAGCAHATPPPPPPPPPLTSSPGLIWRPSWPGTEQAMVHGDLAGEDPWAFRFRMPAGYWIHPHWHPVDARIRVISGTFLVGHGIVLDSSKVTVVFVGQEVIVRKGMNHYEGTRGPTEIEVTGQGPWGITFFDPSKAPPR